MWTGRDIALPKWKVRRIRFADQLDFAWSAKCEDPQNQRFYSLQAFPNNTLAEVIDFLLAWSRNYSEGHRVA